MAPRGRAATARGGFTLLEVLIAMALSAVIMMALFAMFDSVADVAAGVRKQEEASEGVRALESILFDDLRSLYAGKKADFRFRGKSGSFLGGDGILMEFCTSASLGDNSEGACFSLQRVEYALKEDSGAGVLVRREKKYCGLSGRWPWVEAPIFKGVAELELEYFNAGSKAFQSEWDGSNNRYPSVVRFRILGVDGSEQRFSIGLSSMAGGQG